MGNFSERGQRRIQALPPQIGTTLTVLAGLLGMAATAPLGLARATTPAGAAAWNTADEPTLARLLDRVTWGNTAQGAQALPPQGVAAFLAAHPDFVLLSAADILRKQGVEIDALEAGDDRLRLLPHRHGTDGFFAAVLQRT